jgi:large subunit ribosomal protein L21
MDYAIINLKGHQYQIKPNQDLIVDRLDTKVDQEITIDQVLLVKDGKKISIGQPVVSNAKVTAQVVEHFKGDKIRVSKFRPKTRYRRVKGFRPYLTKIKVKDIKVK